jgi:ATPase subunit of ABC transporter with duplicated ATPase domains
MRVLQPISGSFKFHIASKPSYLEQDLTFRNLNTNAYGYISDCFPRFNQKEVRTQLSRVGITGDNALKEILHLSGGEQVRIRLLTIMNTTSNILILDEPTNHLDVRAKKALSEAIKKYDGAMILVCHERSFAEELCNAVYDVKQR